MNVKNSSALKHVLQKHKNISGTSCKTNVHQQKAFVILKFTINNNNCRVVKQACNKISSEAELSSTMKMPQTNFVDLLICSGKNFLITTERQISLV